MKNEFVREKCMDGAMLSPYCFYLNHDFCKKKAIFYFEVLYFNSKLHIQKI